MTEKQAIDTGKRIRDWSITINVPEGMTEDDARLRIEKALMTYNYWGQFERGENSGRLHWQGCVIQQKPAAAIRFATLKKKFLDVELVSAHFEPRRGAQTELYAYCEKLESRVSEPFGQGIDVESLQGPTDDEMESRTNKMTLYRDELLMGKTLSEVLTAHPEAARNSKALEVLAGACAEMVHGEDRRDVRTHFLMCDGDALSYVRARYGVSVRNVFIARTVTSSSGSRSIDFSGYAGQKILVILDFLGQCSHGRMMQLCSGYPEKVGSHWKQFQAAWTDVIIHVPVWRRNVASLRIAQGSLADLMERLVDGGYPGNLVTLCAPDYARVFLDELSVYVTPETINRLADIGIVKVL